MQQEHIFTLSCKKNYLIFSRKQEVVVMKLTLVGFSVKLEKSTVCQLALGIVQKWHQRRNGWSQGI